MSCRFSECAWAQACPGAERFFDGLLNAYTRVLDFVLGHQRATLMTFINSSRHGTHHVAQKLMTSTRPL
jgi:hypothetical protein